MCEDILLEIAYAYNGIDEADLTHAEKVTVNALVRCEIMERIKQELDGDFYYEYYVKTG